MKVNQARRKRPGISGMGIHCQVFVVAFALIFSLFVVSSRKSQAQTKITVEASAKMGTYKKFWAGLGQSSFNEGVLGKPQRIYFNLIKKANSNGRQAFQFFSSKSMLNNNRHKSGEEIGAYVYTEDENGNPQYNWEIVDQVCDLLLGSGLKPIINFSFMPTALARDPQRRNPWHNSIVSPPKDYNKWRELIYNVVSHLQERYGAKEIESWYFEVWNEPDLYKLFWIEHPDFPGKSYNEEYFKLYDYTVDGAVRANPNIKIGGPAIAGDIGFFIKGWMPHVLNGLNYATGTKGSRIDFVSRHTYGSVDHILYLSRIFIDSIKRHNPDLARRIQEDQVPYLVTEIGPSTKPKPWLNSRYVAAWIAKMVHGFFYLGDSLGTEYVPDISCFWTKPLPPNFTDHFGLATRIGNQWNSDDNQVVKRPAFAAFTGLSFLGQTRLRVTGGNFGNPIGAFATETDDNSIQIVIYHLLDEDFESNNFDGSYPVNLVVNGLPFHDLYVEYYSIDKNHSNAYTKWKQMGSPARASAAQIEELQRLDDLQLAEPASSMSVTDGRYTKTLKLQHNSVAFLIISNAQFKDTTPPKAPEGLQVKINR